MDISRSDNYYSIEARVKMLNAHIWDAVKASLIILVPLHTGEQIVDKLGLCFDRI